MTNKFPPNTDPNTLALIGVAIAFAITNDFNSYEINTIGNWLELIGQYLLSVGAQQQLIESRIENNNININSKQYKSGGSPFTNNGPSNQTHRPEIDAIYEALRKIEKELAQIKKEI